MATTETDKLARVKTEIEGLNEAAEDAIEQLKSDPASYSFGGHPDHKALTWEAAVVLAALKADAETTAGLLAFLAELDNDRSGDGEQEQADDGRQ